MAMLNNQRVSLIRKWHGYEFSHGCRWRKGTFLGHFRHENQGIQRKKYVEMPGAGAPGVFVGMAGSLIHVGTQHKSQVKSYGVLGRSNKEKKADPPDEAPGGPKIPFVKFRDEVKKGQNPTAVGEVGALGTCVSWNLTAKNWNFNLSPKNLESSQYNHQWCGKPNAVNLPFSDRKHNTHKHADDLGMAYELGWIPH